MSGRVFGSVFDADTGSALISGRMGEKVITQTGTGENGPPPPPPPPARPPACPPALLVNLCTHQHQQRAGHTSHQASLYSDSDTQRNYTSGN